MSSRAAHRLATAVNARRHELDLNQMDVWQAGGPSNTTLTEIENGRLHSLTRTTANKLDHALRWEKGSAKAVWEGGEPTPILRPGMSSRDSQLLREQIEALSVDEETKAAIWETLRRRGSA